MSRLALDELSLTQRTVRSANVHVRATARRVAWALLPDRYPQPVAASADAYPHLWAAACRQVRRSDPDVDPRLEAGKLHNLQLAAPAFDGLELSPTRPLSFWRTLGAATAERGFVSGMELRGGCVVPAIGGGLCLLSNALFEVAARAGCEILERWGHTREAAPPDPALPFGLDATVFFPHVDLRFRPEEAPLLLRTRVDAERLVTELWGATPPGRSVVLEGHDDGVDRGMRTGRLWRDVTFADGSTVRELLAEDRREVMTSTERRRNCMTCGLTACPSRVEARLAP